MEYFSFEVSMFSTSQLLSSLPTAKLAKNWELCPVGKDTLHKVIIFSNYCSVSSSL